MELLAEVSRQFFKKKKIYSYRMHKVENMTDAEVIRYCHWFCEDNGLVEEFMSYRARIESEYYFCPYLQEFIDPGSCYDLQMFTEGYIKPEAVPVIKTEKYDIKKCCLNCRYALE